MGFLGKPDGLFKLEDSDNNIGSYIGINDVCKILNVAENDLSDIKFKNVYGCSAIDELELSTRWHKGLIPNAPNVRVNGAKSSLDEFILISLIKLVYPSANIEHQVKWGRKKIDLRLNVLGEDKFIEFCGPLHFIQSRYGIPENPFKRKYQIEKDFGVECIIWPYWIPRCESNLRAIFEKDVYGKGAIWSANIHFSQFVFDNSAEIIKDLSFRFIKNSECYGSFYEKGVDGVNKPEHFIVEKIKAGKKKKDILLPKGFIKEENWVPNAII